LFESQEITSRWCNFDSLMLILGVEG
jgi:hypothetical protein